MLYPTVMREMLIGAAKARAFEPLWSARILEEWRRAALKHGETAALQVESEAFVPKDRLSQGIGADRRGSAGAVLVT